MTSPGGQPGPTTSDLAWGSFLEPGPWNISRDATWTQGIEVLRLQTRREVPQLVNARRFPPVRRLVVVVATLIRQLAPWWWGARRHGGSTSRADLARRVRLSAERLGPTYIKLAQIVSSGEGVFPAELVTEMRRCRDQVPAEPFEVVRATLETELGRPLEQVFGWFDETPLAAASIAQVHRARLHTGESVVVKVQRPTIGQWVRADLRAMAWIAPLLIGRIPIAALANPPALVELFAETISEELDFRLEAWNMLDVAEMFGSLDEPGFVVPRPHPDLVTRRMLVMEEFVGHPFDNVDDMRSDGIDTEAVLRIGIRGFVEGALRYGVFHGDLHGGNLLVLSNGKIGLLDFGITARMSDAHKRAFLQLVLAAASGQIVLQLAALRDLGALPPDTDLHAVVRDLGLDGPPIDPTAMSPEQLIGELQRLVSALLGYGARLPKVLMLYVKNLVFLDVALARLAPNLDLVNEFVALALHLTSTLGDELTALGLDPAALRVDPDSVRASLGPLDPDAPTVTWAELQARRAMIQRRISGN